MKTSVTYRAQIEIPVPDELICWIKNRKVEEEPLKLCIAAESKGSMAEAKQIINLFVNEVMTAERSGDEALELDIEGLS